LDDIVDVLRRARVAAGGEDVERPEVLEENLGRRRK